MSVGRITSAISSRPWLNTLVVVVGLVVMTLAIFAPVRTFGFLPWDDPHYVYENAHVLTGLGLRNLAWAFTTNVPPWHPLTWLSLMLDVQMYGPSPTELHIANVLMHAVSVVLLFLFLKRTTGAVGPSAFVAAIFAIHPMRVESVAWISERKDVLSVLLLMLALHAYVGWVRRPSAGRYVVVTALISLGLLAKPMLITLPFVLLLLDIWPLGRIGHLGGVGPTVAGAATGRAHQPARRLVIEKIPWMVLAVATALISFLVTSPAAATLGSVPFLLRLANAPVFYVQYLALTVWPSGLSPLHLLPRVTPAWWAVAGSLAWLVSISFLVLRDRARRPQMLVGWFWYLATVFPVIGLIQGGDQAIADRYLYIPSIGLYVIAAWGLPGLLKNWRPAKFLVPALAALLVVAAAAAARAYVWTWRDGVTLWQRAVAVDPTNHRARANLADALASRKRVPEAIAQFQEAIRQAPDMVEYRRFLGAVFARNGQLTEALGEFAAVLRQRPDDAATRNEVGLALARSGRFADALVQHAEAVRLDATSAVLSANLCVALARTGKLDAGKAACLEAQRLDPDLPQAHAGMGAVYLAQGQTEEAVTEFAEAQRLEPLSADRLVNLAGTLARAGRTAQALDAFRRAVQLDSESVEAHNGLGVLLSEQGRTHEAIDEFTAAILIKSDLPYLYSNRGRALALQGDIDPAIDDFEQVLKLDPGNAGARAALDALKKRPAAR